MTPPQLFARLVRECLAFPGRLAIAVGSLIVLSGGQLYLTWLMKRWTDGPMAGDDRAVGTLLTAGVLVTLAIVAAVFVSRYMLNSVNQRMVQRLRDAALARVLAMRVPAARQFHSGELVSRIMNDAGVLSGFVRDVLKRLLGEGLLIIGALSMALYLEWRLALVAAVVVPPVVWLLGRVGEVIRRRAAGAQAEIGDLSSTLQEQLRGLTTIKGFEGEAFERQRFARQNARYRRAMMRGEWWSSLLVTAVWILTGIGLWAILWYGTRQVSAGQITMGGLLAFFLYALQTLEPLRRLSDAQGLLQRALASAARIYEIIDCEAIEAGGGEPSGTNDRRDAGPTDAGPTDAGPTDAGPAQGAMRCEAVSFHYRPEAPVLRGLTFDLRPGEPVALVAASGGGKSTLAALLVRFADPQVGRILLDGVDLRRLSLAALRRAVCVVEQEPFLFSGQLIDNLRYGAWDAPRQRIDDAVRLTGLAGLIDTLPAGLETRMEEAGRNLSVGQKQRIALARAIVRAPSVLVLDEATSALDSDTERHVFSQLDAWLRQRTTLVIAHRLSTISRFERVIVLDRGAVVGDGSVAALLECCPAFRQLFGEQLVAYRQPRAAAG